MTTTAYIVVQFFGNNDILGCQRLDKTFFVKADAEKRARTMQRRNKWIWCVIAVEIAISGEQRLIRDELAARGIKA